MCTCFLSYLGSWPLWVRGLNWINWEVKEQVKKFEDQLEAIKKFWGKIRNKKGAANRKLKTHQRPSAKVRKSLPFSSKI